MAIFHILSSRRVGEVRAEFTVRFVSGALGGGDQFRAMLVARQRLGRFAGSGAGHVVLELLGAEAGDALDVHGGKGG